ncbi:hypothetical protein M2347_004217 [Chryseobacterium sp. H1D6B]|nr:hypothetical protein [Chryseobacterium sp. H1D6B]MDH6254490.1 hypothetical protein [Chryseobacterium sp. H1D6B]
MRGILYWIYYLWVMDFWTIIGVVSSILGILSFLKNDTVSVISFLKKGLFVFFLGQQYNIKKI